MLTSQLSLTTHYSNVDTRKMFVNRSASKVEDYIEVLKESDVKTVSFTENNNVFSWSKKKRLVESNGMKYIHSVRLNVSLSLSKSESVHTIFLFAKNYQGVKEINTTVSKSYEGRGVSDDNNHHFYYVPRTTLKEVNELSDNVGIIISQLDNPLWKAKRSNDSSLSEWISLLDREFVYIGVSSRLDLNEYKFMNGYHKELSDKYNIKMIVHDKTMSHKQEYEYLRYLINKADKKDYEKTEELALQSQSDVEKGLKEYFGDEYNIIIENTNSAFDDVEDFELDESFKYPKLYDNPIEVIKKLVLEGYKFRGVDKLDKETQKLYQERIAHELSTMQETKSIEYLLLEQYVKEEMRKIDVYPGPGRGSASASLVSYLLRVTDIDPIKENLVFERFMNKDRISLADIDSDYAKEDQSKVQQFLLEHPKMSCASVITYGTFGISGALKAIGRALGYSFSELNQLTSAITSFGDKYQIPALYKEKYSLLIEYAEQALGVITHNGRHAGAILVTDRDSDSEIGSIRIKDFDYRVTAWDMSDIEVNNYVKLDILGVNNIGIVHKATELAKIPRLHTQAEHIDYDDWKMRDDILEYGTQTIFQLENQENAVLTILSDKSLDRIRSMYPNLRLVEVFSIVTAAIRPGADSIRDDVLNGIAHDYGVPEINEILKETFGHLIYQEQTISLIQYAGFTASEADVIRRAIGKKKANIINEWIPSFKETLVNKIMTDYSDKNKDEVVDMVNGLAQSIIESSAYSFNKAHAIAYSYITIETLWLRTYYPIEWTTANFIVSEGKLDKVNKANRLAQSKGIEIERAKFRKSRGEYFFDKEKNTIYEGVEPINGMNAEIGNWLYDNFRDMEFNTFTDFLLTVTDKFSIEGSDESMVEILSKSEDDIKELDRQIKKEEVVIDISYKDNKTPSSAQMLALIRLDYFDEFGGSLFLEEVYEFFRKKYNKQNKTLKSKRDNYLKVLEYEKSLDKEHDLSVFDKATYELQYLKKSTIKDENIPKKYAFVSEIVRQTNNFVIAIIHSINQGKSIEAKVGMKTYRRVPFEAGDVIEIIDSKVLPKNINVNGEWVKSETEKELWLNNIKYIRKKGK